MSSDKSARADRQSMQWIVYCHMMAPVFGHLGSWCRDKSFAQRCNRSYSDCRSPNLLLGRFSCLGLLLMNSRPDNSRLPLLGR